MVRAGAAAARDYCTPALRRLLYANECGDLRSGPAQRGFLCRRAEVRDRRTRIVTRRLPGITRVLNARVGKRVRQAQAAKNAKWRPHARTMRLFSVPASTRLVASSRARGEQIHRHVMHQLICLSPSTGACRCVAATGARAPALAAVREPAVRACVDGARTFAERHGLVPVAGELVVASRKLPYATRIDGLFARRADNALVLVSWKTGLGPRDADEHRAHRTQLAFEWLTLSGSHRVDIAQGYIVYLAAAVQRTGARRTAGYYHADELSAADATALYTAFKRRRLAALARAKARPRARLASRVRAR